ncbi:LOG family protein [Lusitaniella coriacea LEGE 07157]|uniref:LOG family protein n=1 Tax=Lusitaniella coriacea LEGE 07157 TaxID=945747 RepID=A0A8J7IXE5_9CYAN|nr:LOG family protein [Lusitaniella coriacea]MBE9118697.1 LOG family protein [Lusitaniella coriacea LEGE 07157]
MESFSESLVELTDRLPAHPHNKWIQRALAVLVRLAGEEVDRLDWKILTAALEDLEQAFQRFYPYRHIRKISIFGSARTPPENPEYRLAVDFARQIVQQGYMAITGAGGGIMEAANQGATREHSFGLNIQLPFEQGANAFIAGDVKLIEFKYFFTRKLFFLRESDAIAVFPGGFGTLDEVFETLTLSQTGRYGPVPLVLIDAPGESYWEEWNEYICGHLAKRGLVSSEDHSLYTITQDLGVACQTISDFYRVYHSSRYVNRNFVIRLNCELSEVAVEQLNEEFEDILVQGKIAKTQALPQEAGDETVSLPRLIFEYNQRDSARLTQMIRRINQLGCLSLEEEHPERK